MPAVVIEAGPPVTMEGRRTSKPRRVPAAGPASGCASSVFEAEGRPRNLMNRPHGGGSLELMANFITLYIPESVIFQSLVPSATVGPNLLAFREVN